MQADKLYLNLYHTNTNRRDGSDDCDGIYSDGVGIKNIVTPSQKGAKHEKCTDFAGFVFQSHSLSPC